MWDLKCYYFYIEWFEVWFLFEIRVYSCFMLFFEKNLKTWTQSPSQQKHEELMKQFSCCVFINMLLKCWCLSSALSVIYDISHISLATLSLSISSFFPSFSFHFSILHLLSFPSHASICPSIHLQTTHSKSDPPFLTIYRFAHFTLCSVTPVLTYWLPLFLVDTEKNVHN